MSGILFVRDWRRRAIQARTKKIPEQLTTSDITSLRISFLSSHELLENDDGTKHYQIKVAYYPVCLMTEAQRSTLFTCTKKTMTNLILQATISAYTTGKTSAHGSAATETLTNFMTNRKELSRKFLFACYKPSSTKKQLTALLLQTV